MGFGKKKDDSEPIVQGPRGVMPARSKKPPKKPWGKKERYLVAIILAITIVASLIGFITSQGFSMPELYLPEISTDKTIELER